jgi:RimJ/RimL family protein N-acetyltransferase
VDALDAMRRLGPRAVARAGARRLWSSTRALGLRAALDDVPEPRPAAVPVTMEETATESFSGFDDEVAQAGPADRVEVLGRLRFRRAGVTTLYVASDDAGRPIYAQWLVTSGDQDRLHAVTGGTFPRLGEGEALVEGAYTFTAYRKQGAMADGMAQLLRIARDGGARSAITYVSDDNVPSLRGCARVGFDLDHVRVTTRRLGVRRSRRAPLDDAARAAWRAAVGQPPP